jgi:hypothetical protein
MDLWRDLRERVCEDAEWIPLVEDSISNTEKVINPQNVTEASILNGYTYVSSLSPFSACIHIGKKHLQDA